MTKRELLEELLIKSTNISQEMSKKQIELGLNVIFDSMSSALQKHHRIEIRGFGSFFAKVRNARLGRNPRTGETVEVPQKWVPFFTAGKELRERVDS